MANDTYSGGNTILWITKNGISWGGSRDPAAPARGAAPAKTWPDRRKPPTKEEIGLAIEREDREERKVLRSFISQCVFAWEAEDLTASHPAAPKRLRKAVKAAGGNIAWLAGNRKHQVLFHETCCRLRKEEVPFEKIWGPGSGDSI
jgi:hypothetical protein